MSTKLSFTLLLCSSGLLWAQSPWQDLGAAAVPGTTPTRLAPRRIQLDRPRLEALLAGAPAPGSASAALEIPGPDGSVHKLIVRESSVLSPELQARMPEIKTYAVTGLGEPSLTGRFDLTPAGFHAVIMSHAGAFLVEPDSAGFYGSAWLGSMNAGSSSCRVTSQMSARAQTTPDFTFPVVFKQLETLRLAVMVSAQFTETNGGTQASAMAAIVTTVNANNAVYERDLSIHFNVVKMIVYSDSNPEPFPLENQSTTLEALGNLIDQQTGTANYDVGHTFLKRGGGLAALQSACNDLIGSPPGAPPAPVKAQGFS